MEALEQEHKVYLDLKMDATHEDPYQLNQKTCYSRHYQNSTEEFN